jgi:hypothetical protein
VAEWFGLVDETAAVAVDLLSVALLEVELAEFFVGDAALEDVVGGDEDRVGGRERGSGVSATTF